MLLSFLQKYNTVMSITVISRKNYSLQENLTAEFVRGYLVLTQGRSGWRKKSPIHVEQAPVPETCLWLKQS